MLVDNWKRFVLLAALAAPVAVGCDSSDESDPTPVADAGDTADGSGDVVEDVTPDVVPDVTPDVTPDVVPDVTPDVTPDTVEPPTDECQNEADQTILEAGGVTDAAQTCGLGCLGDADPGSCAGACVAEETGLSEGCAGCYAGVVVCSIENCLASCAADPDSAACASCQAENCLADYYVCTGEEPPAPEDACLNEADAAIIAEGNATDEAQTCGLGCLGDADPGACASACVVTETGLSADCAGCYAGIVVCSIDNCLASCAADPDSEACTTCQAENCLEDFYSCTGLEASLGNIVEVADGAGTFTTLLTALEAADLTATLEGSGPFTVFAPTDDAFAALPEGALTDLLADTETLAQVLLYHVVDGEVASGDVSTGPADSAAGLTLWLTAEGSGVMVNMANVETPDVPASNGVIHVIDAVLLPPNLVELSGYAGLSTLGTALETASLVEALEGSGPLTVFGPTNDAFLEVENLEGLLANLDALVPTLQYHVYAGALTGADVAAAEGSGFEMLSGDDAAIEGSGDALLIQGALIEVTDLNATNGILHIIGGVMFPPLL